MSAVATISSVAWPWPDSMDALRAAPQQHRLVLENEHVRVLDSCVRPGETVPLHTHRWPAVLHLQRWSDFVRRDEKGQVLVDTRGKPPPSSLPVTIWSPPLPPHTLENVGTADLHALSVEIKSGASAGEAGGEQVIAGPPQRCDGE